MKHQSLIGLIVFLLSTPAIAHVVGVKHSLPPAPEYKRILEEPVTLHQAIKMHRNIQEARDKRTGVKTEVYAAQTTKSAFQELGVNYCQRRVHRIRGKRSQSCKWGNSIQSARNKRTGSVYVPRAGGSSIAEIQQRRAERTDHLRVIQNVEHNLFRPVLWTTTTVEPHVTTLRSAMRNLQFTNDERADRTGIPRLPIVQRTLHNTLTELEYMHRRGCRPHPRSKDMSAKNIVITRGD